MTNTRRPKLLWVVLLVMLGAQSCVVTRTETDAYTITIRDTTYRETVPHVPGSAGDNGVVYPSNRTTDVSRNTLEADSTYDRKYPAFLRLGGLEFGSMITPGAGNGVGRGLFGIYGLADSNRLRGGSKSSVFKGTMMRFLPYEYELLWFDNAPNWTIGGSVHEHFRRDELDKSTLQSYLLNFYLRRRFFLREKIPYVIAQPFFGMSFAPSFYANAGGELLVGSYGGYNLRGYLGFISGFTYGTPSNPAKVISYPYFSIGLSALDFTNRVEETEREWKDHVHSAIEVSLANVSLVQAIANYPKMFDPSVAQLPGTGAIVQFANVQYPLPVLDSNFWVGTSLANGMFLGFGQQALGMLPIRAGYRQHILAEDLMAEPFAEWNYYPSSFFNGGVRVRLNTFKGFTLGFTLGWASGNSGAFLPTVLFSKGSPLAYPFESGYIGITIGIRESIRTPEAVRRSREKETY